MDMRVYVHVPQQNRENVCVHYDCHDDVIFIIKTSIDDRSVYNL